MPNALTALPVDDFLRPSIEDDDMNTTRRTLLNTSAAAMAFAGLTPFQVFAQRQTMRIISSGAAGSVSDALARPLAAALTTPERTVLVDNRPGAGGFMAINELMQRPADGLTLMQFSAATAIWNKYLFKKLPYDPADIVPVSPISVIPMVLVVHPDFPARTLKEFIAEAKRRGNKMNYAFGGIGSPAHISFARFASEVDINPLAVSYRSGPPAMQDVMAGRIETMLDGVPLLAPQIKAGKLRALAVASRSRVESLPDVPTFIERGVPDFEAEIWVGASVRRGTPAGVIESLNAQITRALQTQQIREIYGNAGALVRTGNVRSFTEFVEAEDRLWGPVIQKAGITVE